MLTAENRDLDAEAHQAQARVNSYDLAKLTWEHEKKVLDRHVEQLEAELTGKAGTLQSVRSQTSSEVSAGAPVASACMPLHVFISTAGSMHVISLDRLQLSCCMHGLYYIRGTYCSFTACISCMITLVSDHMA